jgi:hypothetical protein
MNAANQLPYLMTVAEFLDRQTPDGSDRWELVDGRAPGYGAFVRPPRPDRIRDRPTDRQLLRLAAE